MIIRKVFPLLLLSITLHELSAYRILGIFPLNSRSHEMMFEALMVGLAKRGHQVDVITHFPIKNPPPNYKAIINLAGSMENLVNNFTIQFATSVTDDVGYFVATVYGNRLCEFMSTKEFQHIIHNPPNDPPYDVLITEAFGANCYMGIGHHFKIPIIALSSAVEYPWVGDLTGNADNPAVVPNGLFMAFGKMNFYQRLQNTIMYHSEVRNFQALTEQYQTEVMRKYIDPNMPNIREIERSVALTLVNSHPILFGVKSVLPTVVQVGGIHVEENESKLPLGLLNWMDESKSGVLYFTLGSMVLIETLPENTMKSLYASFAKIAPIRVLMKIANATKLPPGLPENVFTLPWIPQQAVLAHKNTKAFMTHGGLMGSTEALYFGIPTVAIPLFADQPRNVAAFVAKKMTIELPLDDVSETTLDSCLQAILFDPSYRNNAKYHSKLFRDRPMSAMNTSVYWIEYIIRNGPNVLRPPALDLTWWQLALLDVYIFIIVALLLVKLTIYYVLKFIMKKIFGTSSNTNTQLKKKVN